MKYRAFVGWSMLFQILQDRLKCFEESLRKIWDASSSLQTSFNKVLNFWCFLMVKIQDVSPHSQPHLWAENLLIFPRKEGQTGVVVQENQGSDQPVNVKAKNGQTWWYQEPFTESPCRSFWSAIDSPWTGASKIAMEERLDLLGMEKVFF